MAILKGNKNASEDKPITEYANGEVNSPPIKLVRNPGEKQSYDSSGTLVIQLLLEDITVKSFEDLFQRYIAHPLGMTNSSFKVNYPAEAKAKGINVMEGHDYDGTPIDGGWNVLAESAAGGLWSTTEDLSKFGLALIQSYQGKEGSILKKQTMEQMTAIEPNSEFGLGFQVFENNDQTLAIGHGGSMPGYKAQFFLLPKEGKGAVVMTNGNEGTQLAFELFRSVSHVNHWSTLKPKIKKAVEINRESLEQATGNFLASKDRAGTIISGELRLYFQGNKLMLDTPYPNLDSQTRRVCTLEAESAYKFFNTEHGIEVSFSKDYTEFKAFDLTPTRIAPSKQLRK